MNTLEVLRTQVRQNFGDQYRNLQSTTALKTWHLVFERQQHRKVFAAVHATLPKTQAYDGTVFSGINADLYD